MNEFFWWCGFLACTALAVATNQNLLFYAAFLTCSLFVYFPVSGGDFSFFITYGAMARMFGLWILNVKIFKSQRGAAGVSVKTLQLYCLVFCFLLTSIIRHEGYLPYDKSGDWLYHVIEIITLILSGSALCACCMGPYKHTYQAELDTFGERNVPAGLGAICYLAVPVFILAVFVHPNLNSDFLSDIAWTYATYLEPLALLPQLYMFYRDRRPVELLTAHFVAAMGFGRFVALLFWFNSYHEFAYSVGSRLPGYLAIGSQFLQLVLMSDFFWHYYTALKDGTPLVLQPLAVV